MKNLAIARGVTVIVAVTLSLIIALAMVAGQVSGQQAQTSSFGFTQPANISSDGNNAQYPWVAASGSNAYVVWTELSHGIQFRASSDNGSTWGTAQKLNSGLSGTSNYPVMVANSTYVYVIWTQVYLGLGTIYFAGSSNSGASFGSPVRLSGASVNADIPYIAEYDSNVYAIWHQITNSGNQSVWASSSTNDGSSWISPSQLDNAAGIAGSPQIAAFGSYAYATWNGGGAWFSETNNSGASWTAPVNVGAPNTQFVDSPWISASGTNVYVTWNDNYTGVYAPYISISNDSGSTWSQTRTSLFAHATNDYQVQSAASGNNVYVIFRDHSQHYPNSRNGSVIFEASNDSGVTWMPYYSSTSGDLSNGSAGITGWADGIAVSGNIVGFAYLSGCSIGQYEPFPNSGNGDCNMYASYSNDSGTSFLPQVQLSNDFLAGPIRQISTSNYAISGSNMYAAWQDNQTSNFQIYFSDTNLSNSTTSSSSSTTTSSNTTTSTSTTSSTSSTSISSILMSSSSSSSTSTTTSSSVTTTTPVVKASNFDLYAGVAVIVAAVIIASAVLLFRRSRART